MITKISHEIEAILNLDPMVESVIPIKNQSDIEKMINVDMVKSVGYTIKPLKINTNGSISYEVIISVCDVSSDDNDVFNAVVDSSCNVVSNLISLSTILDSYAEIETEIQRENDNDKMLVLVMAKITATM